MPSGMPPLTPGTNKKLAEVLKASFETWEKEAQNRNITKGKSIFVLKSFLSIGGFIAFIGRMVKKSAFNFAHESRNQ